MVNERRVRGKASSASSLTLSVSVRVNEDNAVLDTGHGDFLNGAVTTLLASAYKVGAYQTVVAKNAKKYSIHTERQSVAQNAPRRSVQCMGYSCTGSKSGSILVIFHAVMTNNLPICGQYQLTFYINELHALTKRLGATDWKALTLFVDPSNAISAVLRKISMSNAQT